MALRFQQTTLTFDLADPAFPTTLLGSLRDETTQAVRITRDPLPVYLASNISFLKDTVLETARRTWFEYTVVRGQRPVATLQGVIGNRQLSFSGLFHGEYLDRLMNAVSAAEDTPQVQRRDYEVRILRAPTVLLHAVWLWSTSDDLILPIWPAPPPLEAHTVYTEQEITTALRPLAIQRSTVSDEDTVL